jgi:glutamate synthase (NADPH/NADH)
MEELRKAHLEANRPAKPKYEPSGLGDKRLSLYGYSTETVHMLLLPMINNK